MELTRTQKYVKKASCQKLFDTMFYRLYKQGRRSADRGTCKSRDSNGNKCAVGHLIFDQDYGKPQHLEGGASSMLGYDFYCNILSVRKRSLLVQAQQAHDWCKFKRTFRSDLEREFHHIARYLNLSTAYLDKVVGRW